MKYILCAREKTLTVIVKDDKKSRKINFNNPGNLAWQRTDWKNNSSEK